ncbi:MAG: tetratricopeptide repeat protein [Acidobacteriota bacterium]|nr:tetratricopeptide repeat protein [Acidobacteriota bacterium]
MRDPVAQILSLVSTCGLLLAALTVLPGCASPGPQSRAKDGPLHHYQLARMHFEQGRVPKALEELERSIELDDSLPQTHHYKGYIFWNLAEWDIAAVAFEKAISLQPYYTDSRMFLATCLENKGDIDGALAQLNEASRDRTYGAREKVYLNRAMILGRQGRLGDALSDLRSAVELKPRYYRAHFEMARVLDRLERLEEALTAFEAAEPGYEEDAQFHYERGKVLFRGGLLSEAERMLRKAMELAPGSESAAKARELLGVIG